MAVTIHRYFVSCPRGVAPLLQQELEALGGRGIAIEPSGCRVRGPLGFGYRMCLWSRLASRVVLLLEDAVVEDGDALYDFVRGMPWEDHLDPSGSLAVSFSGEGAGIHHSQFGAQRVKDAVVDRFRERSGNRPNVDKVQPDLRITAYLRGRGCSVGIDLSGDGLHRRGYRTRQGVAPIKENLAAALLALAGWEERARQGAPLLDPMVGSGTVAIEAAMIAADRAPGRHRAWFGFEYWRGHERAVWSELLAEADARAKAAVVHPQTVILGFDRAEAAVEVARQNAEQAGVADLCRFACARVEDLRPPLGPPGLLVTNPPYGERLGDKTEARATLAALGSVLRGSFAGWSAAIVATDDGLLHALGMPWKDALEVANGPTPARMARFEVATSERVDHPLWNRLRKNHKHLRKWASRENVTCYRVYDADLPDYNAAIDLYEGRAHVQEYEAPDTIEPELAARRLAEVTSAVSDVFTIPAEHVFLKTRRRQRGSAQYQRMGSDGQFFVIEEGGHKFWVNLADYLDTGLFLDHRKMRGLVGETSKGARVLNLFCYTGSVSVYAAKGGAASTTSVDLSNTYLDWAARNFALNEIREGQEHRIVRADCLAWLEAERATYDLIVLDPPTFSNSKAMANTWDVRRDHAWLIGLAMARLRPGGALLFSTNANRFRLDASVEQRWACEPLTRKTTSQDFAGKNPHQSWRVRERAPQGG